MNPDLILEVSDVLKQQPLLTYFGFGEFDRPMLATRERRNQLLSENAIREIQLCRLWLAHQKRTQRISRYLSSYSLKHRVEFWTGMGHPRAYVSNGAFIAAALMDGWKVQRCSPVSPNAFLNISRSLNYPSPPELRGAIA